MKLKKLAAFGAVAAMVLSLSLTPAHAANTSDTEWSFSMDPSHAVYTTPLREKTNSSAVYVYYQGGTVAYLTCDVLNSESQSMCKGRIGKIDKGAKGRIAQYVYENGFRFCKLQLRGPSSTYGGASGYWSPDCAGSYPYIN